MIAHRYRKKSNDSMKNGFGRGEMIDYFTLSGTSEAENISSFLGKPSDI